MNQNQQPTLQDKYVHVECFGI